MSNNSFCTPVRDLFPLLQNEAGDVSKDNVPFSLVKSTLDQEAYANMVSTIVSDAVPSIQKEYISCDVKKFFTSHAIDSDVTFLLLADSDFSASHPIPQDVDWKTHASLTMMTVWNTLLKVHRAVSLLKYKKYFLQDGVTFTDILVVNSGHDAGQIGRPGRSDPGSFTVQTGQLEWKLLKIKSFSGKPEDFPGWKEHVELVFTKFAALLFLTSLQTCKELPKRSNSYVGSLREALKDSIISAAANKHKIKLVLNSGHPFYLVFIVLFYSILKSLKVGTAPFSTAAMRCLSLLNTKMTSKLIFRLWKSTKLQV